MRRSVLAIAVLAAVLAQGLTAPPSFGLQNREPPAGSQAGAAREGQVSVLLPDGRWLVVGGAGPDGRRGAASLWDPRRRSSTLLVPGPAHARAGHTATVLPDGTVLVLGGLDPAGRLVAQAELFDPATARFRPLLLGGPTARAHHTATLLTNGLLLIAGGLGPDGKVLADAELWDARARRPLGVSPSLVTARRGHTARLMGTGEVVLRGGLNAEGVPLDDGEVFDPDLSAFYWSPLPPQSRRLAGTARLMGSLPASGARHVPVEGLIALRFSQPLDVMTVNVETVLLTGPEGRVPARVVAAEGGMLAFVTPEAPLRAATTYTLLLAGPAAPTGDLLASAIVSFTTAGSPETGAPTGRDQGADEDDDSPGEDTADHDASWESLPPLEAPRGVTAVSGQVLLLNGRPLAGVTLEIDGHAVRTDATGRFLLTDVPAGHQELEIDGRTASRPGATYGLFEAGVGIAEGETNVLPYKIWMPRIDTAHAVPIPAYTTSEVVVTTPRIPGLELHIPAHAAIKDHEGRPVTELSITPIPVERPPFPLAAGVEVPIYYTIQPGGAYVYTSGEARGARLVYPNYTHALPGERANFWHYDPEGRGWYIYGQGSVTSDGAQVVPDPGVTIYEFTGAMISVAGYSPPPDGTADGTPAGDPVDLGSGLFVLEKTDLVLPDVMPLALTRTYRPRDPYSRAFGIGATHFYDLTLWSAQQYSEADLILPDGKRIHYVRISSGTGFQDAIFEHTSTPTVFYKSRLQWNGHGWDLSLEDGTVLVFGENAPLQSIRDRNGNTTSIARTGSANPQLGNISKVTSPHGRWLEFSYDGSKRVTQARDNMGRTVGYTYDASGRLWKVTDANRGVTEYTYDASHRMLTLKDPKGIVFLTNEYDAGGRVTRQTQADGSTYQFVYTLDGNGKITQADVTDPRGFLRRVTFNSTGHSLSDTRAVGRPEQQVEVYERQAGTNFVTAVTDALGRQTTFQYDAAGNLTSVSRLAGTPEQVTTSFTYEPTFNQVASVTDPLNHTTTFAYDAKGSLIRLTDPLGKATTLVNDPVGQPVSVTNPLNKTTQLGYYLGDLATVTDPLGRSASRIFDGGGRVVSATDQLGNRTVYEYDALNQPTRLTDALGGETDLANDPNGNLLSVTDPRGNPTLYTYDVMDRLATRQDPLLKTESFAYDSAGNTKIVTDRKSQVTSYTYDALGRRTVATYADQSTTAYSYDAGDRLTQVQDSQSGTITLSYDGLDRLTQEAGPRGTVSYTYDAAGRRTSMTVAGQPSVTYAYDNADRLTRVTRGALVVELTYDDAGRRTSLTLPNGVEVEHSYDNADQLTGLTYRKGTTVLGTLTYTYDAAGNRKSVGGTWARTGLPQAATASFNAANQLVTFNTGGLTYDFNGDLTGDGSNTYGWNARGQLTSLLGPLNNGHVPVRRAGAAVTEDGERDCYGVPLR